MDMMSRSPTCACWRAIIGLSSSSNAYSMPARNFAENSSLSGWMSRPKAQKSCVVSGDRSEEHTSELHSLMRSSYAVICLQTIITQLNDNEMIYSRQQDQHVQHY